MLISYFLMFCVVAKFQSYISIANWVMATLNFNFK